MKDEYVSEDEAAFEFQDRASLVATHLLFTALLGLASAWMLDGLTNQQFAVGSGVILVVMAVAQVVGGNYLWSLFIAAAGAFALARSFYL